MKEKGEKYIKRKRSRKRTTREKERQETRFILFPRRTLRYCFLMVCLSAVFVTSRVSYRHLHRNTLDKDGKSAKAVSISEGIVCVHVLWVERERERERE